MRVINPERDSETLNLQTMTRREFKDLVYEAYVERLPKIVITGYEPQHEDAALQKVGESPERR